MGAEHEAGLRRVDEERVLHLARGVVGVKVEGVEVEPLGLHLGPLGDLPAHGDERVAHALLEGLEWVARALEAARDREGDVHGLFDEDAGVALGLEFVCSCCQGAANVGPRGAHALASVGLLGRR